jgi:hypothetical protein
MAKDASAGIFGIRLIAESREGGRGVVLPMKWRLVTNHSDRQVTSGFEPHDPQAKAS